MKTSDFDFDLPEDRVARAPAERREDARLMRVGRGSLEFSHHTFCDLPEWLGPGDVLALNDSRVFPARLLGRRAPEGGRVEVLLTRRAAPDAWWALVRPGKRIRQGDRMVFAPGRLEATVEAYGEQGGGERLLRFEWQGDWWAALEAYGHVPLPPYILRARKEDARAGQDASSENGGDTPADRERYQTVYASDERASVAAPTAGLHFAPSTLARLDARGVERVFLQLHVGPGTFQPIKTERVEDHPIHEEFVRLSSESAARLNVARASGKRIVAVGTTVVRALETAALARDARAEILRSDANEPAEQAHRPGAIEPIAGWTRLMIAPGFEFRATDALLTNFHLPRSSLLLLVSALAGRETILSAYREAIERAYRFYSYGDCMFIE